MPFESTKNRGLLELTLKGPAAFAGSRKHATRTSQEKIPRAERVRARFPKKRIPDGHLRHSKFVGLREDKKARDVVREG